jgi:pimeloyl-ACP methyl ester carboxylesterase
VGGVRWEYIACGEGGEAFLILPGGAMVGEDGFTRIPDFEDRYRVIAPSYASVSTTAELLDGLAGVLDAEGVSQAHVLGPSYGGIVAQCFVRRHPERVRSLVLANTGAPGASPLPGLPLLARLFGFLPEGALRRMTGWNWRRWFVAPPEERAFWYGLIDELLITRLTKADLISALEEMVDFDRQRFDRDDLAGWPGRMLVIESEHDQAFSPEARAALRALYPQASVRTFADAGHAVMMSQPEEYIAAVRSFLEES